MRILKVIMLLIVGTVFVAKSQFLIDTADRFNPSINIQDSLERIVRESMTNLPEVPAKLDTIQVRYNFIPGDTLVYSVLAFDSIALGAQPVLRKTRLEELRVICDSVGANGHYYLTLTYPLMHSFAFSGDSPGIQSDENPWIGRRINIEIDSLGKKYSYYYDNPKKFALNSGGAFQQQLIPDLGESIKAIEESWLVKSVEEVPENGAPPPLVTYSSLFRMKGRLDTLGYKCHVYEFIKAGQGSLKLRNMNTMSYYNSWNRVIIGTELQVPIFMKNTREQKIVIKAGKGNEERGKHFINASFKLIDVKKAAVKEKKKTKSKKTKKRK